ncbi:C2 domain-containing protein 5 [Aedes aegypti]|uniref:Uncharacterized protein n=1 Tax=Aedes aegypti TaxID=7159 RepID=A0A6I8TE20_AEDAE|nr:C2 domain-containing protein 5 [Aedes aegypti]
MPGKVKVKVLAGRNLPVMDRGSDTTDAFVEIKFGSITHKTDVCRKSLNPVWNSDWYRFEVDDADLQDEPLQIRLMDYDTYSANDAIGKVYINLSPLLHSFTLEKPTQSNTGKGSVMSGWIPVYDTMNGVRGEVNVIVKVDLFTDFNKFRQSSCGVRFFHSPVIPHGYNAHVIHGFVEELVVNDDPEYQWIDKIRTPRASNEARQIVFMKLSGQVQRKIGLKAIELGANAVIGYAQCFDLEGDVGVVARGIGTAVTLVKIHDSYSHQVVDTTLVEENEQGSQNVPIVNGVKHTRETADTAGSRVSQSPAKAGTPGSAVVIIKDHNSSSAIHRRSSDSDLSITPKGNSLTSSDRYFGIGSRGQPTSILIKPLNQDALELLEYPFLTITKVPPGFVLHLGATVSARSVKLLARVPNPDDPETRDMWWNELRMEIRSHARAIGCNMVLGYTETTTISEDVCVLSAIGTAAVINLQHGEPSAADSTRLHGSSLNKEIMTSSLDGQEFEKDLNPTSELSSSTKCADISDNQKCFETDGMDASADARVLKDTLDSTTKTASSQTTGNLCGICHIPYSRTSIPFRINTMKCAVCKNGSVPDVLLCTIEIPEGLQVDGHGILIQAHACRSKRDLKGESNAKEMSDALPFLEIELHKLLINKLKMKGMNAIFGLKTSVAVGERMMALVATGTAVYLSALSQPALPKIVAGNSWADSEKLVELQKSIHETVERNREFCQLKPLNDFINNKSLAQPDDSDDSEEEMMDLDLTHGNKETCVLEVDDIHDLEIISLLMEPCPPEGFHVVNTQVVPGLHDVEVVRNLQMFTQVWRAKLPTSQPNISFSKHYQRLLQAIYFKLRAMVPCAICDLRFKLDLPENDEIQLLVTGMALGLGEPFKHTTLKSKHMTNAIAKDQIKRVDDDLIFNLDEDNTPQQTNNAQQNTVTSQFGQSGSIKYRRRSPCRGRYGSGRLVRHMPLKERYGVDITPLSYVPGGRIEKYLGNLDFFFIRECTAVKENGGLSGFVHSFITEVLAVVRAHVTSLGGNAMVSFYMTELVLVDNLHKNQGQCLMSAGGDVVFVSYYRDD